jgi:hypothetical protein
MSAGECHRACMASSYHACNGWRASGCFSQKSRKVFRDMMRMGELYPAPIAGARIFFKAYKKNDGVSPEFSPRFSPALMDVPRKKPFSPNRFFLLVPEWRPGLSAWCCISIPSLTLALFVGIHGDRFWEQLLSFMGRFGWWSSRPSPMHK